jgi:mRNA interferase MazF
MCVICPITSKVKGFPFEVPIPSGSCGIEGAILANQGRSIDWRARPEITFSGDSIPDEIIELTVAIYCAIVGYN